MKKSLLRTGSTVFLLIIIGKIFSLAREMYFSALFGTSEYADAYFTANIIPNLLNTPLTISSLVFFIPLYVKCKEEKGRLESNKFASNLMSIYVIFNIMLGGIAFVFAPIMIKMLVPNYDYQTYLCTVRLSQLLVLSFPVTIAVFILINVSNGNQKHFAPQLLIVCNSAIAIVLMYFMVPKLGIYAVPLIGLISWIIQLFFQGNSVRGQFRYEFHVNLKDPMIKTLIMLAIPVIVATAAEQINLSVDNVLAASLGTGSVSIMNYAQKLFNLLNGTITTALITVSYPIFSRLFAEQKMKLLVTNINKYFSVIVLIMIPTMLLCMLFREEIVRLVFARGAFTESSIQEVGNVFMVYTIAILFASLKELVTRIFYIFGESRLPMIINVLCIGLNIILSLIFVKYFGIEGIVGATAIATIVSCILEIIIFRHKFKEQKKQGVFSAKQTWISLLASLLMLIVSCILNSIMKDMYYIVRCIGVAFIGMLVYGISLVVMKETICMGLVEKLKVGKKYV